jgi:hypothetical protein
VSALWLMLHGGIVLLVGNLAGIPFGRAIVQRRSEEAVRAWRVAHSGLTSGGSAMIAIAAALPHLGRSSLAPAVLIVPLVASGYGFALALTYGAWLGHRGLAPKRPWPNVLVFLGNATGALGALIGTVVFLAMVLSSL